jgi:hypothetical protein
MSQMGHFRLYWRSWPPGPLLLSPERRPWRGRNVWHSGRARVAALDGQMVLGLSPLARVSERSLLTIST